MTNDLARWQFATTSIYHFLFVPVTIGLAFLVAVLQTAWHRNGKPEYRRLTRFFGTLLLINVAVGVVTGLVQEFEFGMNWSVYSRYVGDVFGGPLAMEGLAAFFLESTFLGLWLFGWDRLSKRVHLACIWIVAFATMLSALFIMAANSWMQHPVGYKMVKGQPQLDNIGALFTNPTFLWGFVHVILASLITGAMIMLAISAWYLRTPKGTSKLNTSTNVGGLGPQTGGYPEGHRQTDDGHEVEAFKRTASLSLAVLIPSIVLTLFVGSELGVVETKYQPMKIAAAEGQWNTCQPCSFSLFQIGGGKDDKTPSQIIEVPHVLSLLATNSWNGKVIGLNQLQAEYEKKYGPGNYVPDVFIQYWSMRIMAYLAALVMLLALWGAWLLHRGKLEGSKWFLRLSIWAVATPFLMNTAGWLLTESGRQPWIVQGLMKTANANSQSVTATDIWISLIVFVLLYLALGAADVVLMLRYARKGLGHEEEPPTDSTQVAGQGATAIPTLTY
jgi:cytochrome d ubiquinol oxidase subunit I